MLHRFGKTQRSSCLFYTKQAYKEKHIREPGIVNGELSFYSALLVSCNAQSPPPTALLTVGKFPAITVPFFLQE